LDTDLDPITVVDRRERSLDLVTEMQCDAIGGLGGVQRPFPRKTSEWVEVWAQRLGNEDLVDPGIHLLHVLTLRRARNPWAGRHLVRVAAVRENANR